MPTEVYQDTYKYANPYKINARSFRITEHRRVRPARPRGAERRSGAALRAGPGWATPARLVIFLYIL